MKRLGYMMVVLGVVGSFGIALLAPLYFYTQAVYYAQTLPPDDMIDRGDVIVSVHSARASYINVNTAHIISSSVALLGIIIILLSRNNNVAEQVGADDR